MQGDNLDSVETSEIRVTVGGEECAKTPNSLTEIFCTAPSEPPGGENPAMINVSDCTFVSHDTVPSGDRWEQHRSSTATATDLHIS